VSRRELGLFALVAGLVLHPPLLVLAEQGGVAPFRLFASDAFYYLALALRSAEAGFFTFDGQYPTNGFHPLWGALLRGIFAVLPDPGAGLRATYALSAGLLALGAGLLAVAARRRLGASGLVLLGLVPGALALLLPPIRPTYGTLWSFANGMESAASVAAFGALALVLTGARPHRPGAGAGADAGLSALLAAVVAARLDDVFLVPVVAGAVLLAEPDWRRGGLRALRVAALPALGLAVYLIWNLRYAGLAMPVSGAAKAGGPIEGALRNLYALGTTLLPFLDLRPGAGTVWDAEAWRVLQMVAPAAVAAGALWLARRRLRDGDGAIRPELVLAAYILARTGHGFLFVGLWHQGQWYYPAAVLGAGLLLVGWLGSLAGAPGALARPGPRRLLLLGASLLALLHANTLVSHLREGKVGLRKARVFAHRAETDAALQRLCGGCGVVEFDDGILSFSLRRPVLSGIGLALDAEGVEALRRGELLALAWRRGYRLLASVHYALPAEVVRDPQRLPGALRRHPHLAGQKLDGYRFALALEDPASGVAFIAFAPPGGRLPGSAGPAGSARSAGGESARAAAGGDLRGLPQAGSEQSQRLQEGAHAPVAGPRR